MAKSAKIIMLGPDKDGLGGISRVVKIWQDSGLFEDNEVLFIPTVSDYCTSKLLFLIISLLRFISQVNSNCHSLYLHTSSRHSFYRKSLFIVIGIMFRKKIALHIHPSHFKDFVDKNNFVMKNLILYLLSKIDVFVVISESMKSYIESIFPDKTTYLLRNPINVDCYQNINNIARESNSLLYLGWFIKEKGVYDLVDAVSSLVTKGVVIHLNFYGTKHVDELNNYIKDKGMGFAISVNDWISDNVKLDTLYRHTLLILPSYSEGMPNVILEAMATNTPIISTRVGGLCDVLVDNQNAVIVEPNNPLDLSNKIMICLYDRNLRDYISKNAFMLVKAMYDINVIKHDVKFVFNRLLEIP